MNKKAAHTSVPNQVMKKQLQLGGEQFTNHSSYSSPQIRTRCPQVLISVTERFQPIDVMVYTASYQL